MKRKLTAAIMAACMVTGLLAGCGGTAEDDTNASTNDTAANTAQDSASQTEDETPPPNFQKKINRPRKK